MFKNKVRARAPLRLGLAGGGTDVSPYCDNHGGVVLNTTIDRYAYAVIHPLDEPKIHFNATDLQVHHTQFVDEAIVLDGVLNLHKAVYRYFYENYNDRKLINFELTTFCDAPAGSGLGSSSTLVVAMIMAFVEYLNLSLDEYEIARLAFRLERIDCALQGGRQDQYSATFGGFNFMEFYANERTIVNPLRMKSAVVNELEASLLLFFTGVSRESAKIIDDQVQGIKAASVTALEAMHGLRQEAIQMKECLLTGDFVGVVESMRMGWENKKRSAKTVTNPHIEKIYNAAIEAGALAGKVSGAGGGGFMLFFVPTENRMNVIRQLNKFQGEVSNCHFTKTGAQSWKI
jgi:D-glycero-alpha-D-manno-heptose-7-phosphate kinase